MRTAIEVNSGSAVASLDELPHVGRVEVEPVALDEEVEAGRVAAPHLEAVDGRQRQLDRGARVDGRRSRVGPGQLGDRGRGAQPVAGAPPTPRP